MVAPVGGYTGSNTPGGYVNITVCGSNSNGNDGCQGGAAPVGPGGVATLTVGGGEYIGTYSYQAVYTGDTNFYGSTAKAKYIYVGKATTSLSLTEPGGNYSVDGALVAITATLVADNGGAGSTLIGPPTGNITFTVTDPIGPVADEQPENQRRGHHSHHAALLPPETHQFPLPQGGGRQNEATQWMPPSLSRTHPRGWAYAGSPNRSRRETPRPLR